MSGPDGIDWEWAQRTGGNLDRRQKLQLSATLARSLPAFTLSAVRTRMGRRGSGALDFGGITLPDSKLAKAAEMQARESVSAHVLEHSYRTYYFGRVLAALDGATYDDEIVYVASLLHDLNLERPTPGTCFAVVGGTRAVAFAAEHGAEPERAQAIGAAIAAHITVGVDGDLSDPGGFVSAGASADVMGSRVDEFSPEWVDELLQRHPRLGFKKHMVSAWLDESKAVPNGRANWARRYAMFPLLIRQAPFAE
ncbi:phosphohydrolase [Antrihabitans sp. YC3-6]|uniref:Phosphohydrolase n=1 Tax=Antrihabitans stalagmiti TaxID=2799499 RepID=A0A934NPZ3_9NOCA|nr:phosphohydrolase [Antrihabitans stalagmiti]MBJ8339281.1 phosphohydrolase [Antrihabitans stalagmiti]